jgi:hypothetical protein
MRAKFPASIRLGAERLVAIFGTGINKWVQVIESCSPDQRPQSRYVGTGVDPHDLGAQRDCSPLHRPTGYRFDDAWFLDQEDRRLEPPVAEALRAWEHERVQPLRMHIAHGNP